MNNDNLKMPDDLFKQGLDGFEAPFQEAAWDDMRSLLDKADRKKPFLLWFRRNKKSTTTLITITMITTAIISVWTLFNTGTTVADKKETQLLSQKNGSKNEQTIVSENPAETPKLSAPYNPETSAVYSSNAGTKNPVSGNNSNTIGANDQSGNPVAKNSANGAETPGPEGTSNPDGGTDEETPVKKKKVENEEKGDQKTEVSVPASEVKQAISAVAEKGKDPVPTDKVVKKDSKLPSYTTFRGPWMGIHFTMQYPEVMLAMDSIRQNAGFNFQFMSRNLIPRNDFGAYLGMDFGMQFYGRSKNTGVVLNNTELDSGFTRLHSQSFDIVARGHFEYARFKLKPYVNAMAGPRIYATGQYTEAYHHKQDYENSNSTNVHTSVSFMYGAAIGARFAVSKHVSLDARVEYMRGSQTRIVDLDKSTFNGSLAQYSLQRINLQPAYTQFKFGVLFDLWDGNEDHEYEPTKNNEVTEETEYYYFDSTTNQYIKVNCKCKESPVGNDSTENAEEREDHRSSFPVFNPEEVFKPSTPRTKTPSRNNTTVVPGGGGGSRGSFPGIKPGGSGKIRN